MNSSWLRMLGRNAALTAGCVVACVVLGFLVGSLVAAARWPDAARFVSQGGMVDTANLNHYYAARDGVVQFCAWAGLLIAQAVFVADQFARGRAPLPVTGAFPVQEP